MEDDYVYGAASPQNDMLIPLLGDANLDGSVDGFGNDILLLNWLQSYKTWVDGDFNRDEFIDGFDNDALLLNWLGSLSR